MAYEEMANTEMKASERNENGSNLYQSMCEIQWQLLFQSMKASNVSI